MTQHNLARPRKNGKPDTETSVARSELSEIRAEWRLALKICALLHGRDIGRAHRILDCAKGMLSTAHIVDKRSPHFTAVKRELLGHQISSI